MALNPIAVAVRNFKQRRTFTPGYRPSTTVDPLAEAETLINYPDRTVLYGVGDGSWLEAPMTVNLDSYFRAPATTYNAAFTAACADLPNGGVVRLGTKKTYTFAPFTIPQSITLLGNFKAPPFPGTNQSLNLNSLQSVRIQGTGGITYSAGSGTRGFVLAPAGMSFPQPGSSAWTGTAFTIAGDQTLIADMLVLGFAQVFTSTARARGIIRNLFFDCNQGLYLQDSYDTTRWSGIHCWPFATIETYAGTFGTLPDGDPNKTVDGYDVRPNLRTGYGMKFRGSNDDSHVEDAILVGFIEGYDLESTSGIHMGRIWAECYGRPGSIGMRFGPNVSNVHVVDAQLWSSAAPLLLEMNPTEKVTFGNIRTINPLFAPITIKGGNLAFATCTCFGTPAASSLINIFDSGNGAATASQVSGVLWDETFSSQQPAVLVPTGFILSNLDNLKIRSTRPTGTSLIGGAVVYAQYLTAAQTILLPPNGEAFNITGTTQIEKLGGGHAGRVVRLQFKGPATLAYTGALGGGIAGSVQGVTTRAFAAGGICQLYYDAEYGNWREMFFKDNSTPGSGAATIADGSVTNAKLATVPAVSLIGNLTGGTAAAAYGTMSQFLDTIVAAPGVMLARGSSGWQSIGFGTSGQVLYSQGSGNLPIYGALPNYAASFVTSARLQFIADIGGTTIYNNGNTGAGTTYEPYNGAVVTGHGANSSGFLYSSRFRYLQYQINGSWFTVGIA